MKNLELLQYSKRIFFTLEDMGSLLNQALSSVRVFAARKVASGQLLRLRRNLYVLKERWEQLEEKDFFHLANMIQTPSCISFLSAFSYYHLTTQIVSSVIESLNPVRSKSYHVKNLQFRYLFCQKDNFFAYRKENGFFIAEPEKALIDILYFSSLGRYAFDQSALDLKLISWKRLEKYLKIYPSRLKKYYHLWRKQYEGSSKT